MAIVSQSNDLSMPLCPSSFIMYLLFTLFIYREFLSGASVSPCTLTVTYSAVFKYRCLFFTGR